MKRDLPTFDEIDRRIVIATQGGLPLTPRPYHAIAGQIGISAEEVMQRVKDMLARGAIRRIGAVPNHYAIGYTANGMCVWDIDDSMVDAAGEAVGQLDAVTHCYRRPRHPPVWNYKPFRDGARTQPRRSHRPGRRHRRAARKPLSRHLPGAGHSLLEQNSEKNRPAPRRLSKHNDWYPDVPHNKLHPRTE